MKYQICIDLTADVNDVPLFENIPLMSSPLFDTIEEADEWYRGCYFEYENIDIILIKYNEENQIEDTYIYG